MVLLVKEYEIPFFGKVQLLDSNGGYAHSLTGRYYSINNRGTFCVKCNSVDELTEKMAGKIKTFLSVELNGKKEELEKLERVLKEVDNLNGLENYKEWLKQYQTSNPFQLEFQHKKIEFMGDDQ